MNGININNTIDKMVKDKFLAIFNEAQKSAETTFRTTIKSRFNDLSNFDKIKLLKEEKEKINAIEDEVKILAYASNSTTEEWLLKSFASRTAVLNTDESEELRKAVYTGRFLELITDELLDIKDSIPAYTYEDFLNGKEDPILTELDYYWHLPDKEDWDKIRLWQANKIVVMLSFETSMIINTTQTKLSANPNALEILTKDLQHYEGNIKNKRFNSSKELISELKPLSFLADYDFQLIDNENALSDFHVFYEQDLSWNRINPQYMERSRSLLNEAGKTKPFSESPIIFYTIAQVMQWIEKIVNGQPLMSPFTFPDYDAIVDETIKDSEIKAEKTIEDFERTFDIYHLSKENAERYYIDALEGIRHEFNDLEEFEKQYFASIHRDDVKQVFQINAIFFDFEGHKEALAKAANLYHRLSNFYADCRNFTGSNRINYPNTDSQFNPSEISYLAATMVLDNDLHEKLSNVYKNALTDMMQHALPIDLMLQNVKEQMHEVFIECIERLLNYLENCEPGNKVMYIQSRLKDLRQRELKNKMLSNQYGEHHESGYTTLFKEYLELEADFISSTKDVRYISALNEPKQKKELTEPEKFSFGYKQKDTTKLLSFVTQLNLKIDLLNEDYTSPNDLMVVLSANELNNELPKIYFNCETTQLYYVFNKLKTYFTKLTFKNIEDSQLFFTKNGNPLKGQNLSASKVDFPKNQMEIDQAFSLLQ
jgi:hypothetical protein